jgi:tetratricopeptide (TPR) repeat protein
MRLICAFAHLLCAVTVGLAVTQRAAAAAEPCAPVVGVLASAEGQIDVQRKDSGRWQPVATGTALCEGDTIRAAALCRATIQLVNEAVLRVDQNTTLKLVSVTGDAERRSVLDLVSGAIQSFSRKPRKLAINTPYVNGLIEGTEFAARAGDGLGTITVIEGTVVAENSLGRVTVPAGSAAVAEAGRAPAAQIVIDPRDAVQWALYYPPLLAASGGGRSAAAGAPAPVLAEAMAKSAGNDNAGAIALLDQVPETQRDATFHLYRAAFLLDAGQVEPARAAIDTALARDPQAGLAYALRAVIAVVQNDREAALADSGRAVGLAPDLAAPRIAQSYALQADFRLAEASDSLRQAVERDPDNALAWARLAELRLMDGDRTGSREAADRAVALAPDLARTQTVKGFADLAAFRKAGAEAAFGRAIQLSPADPLAHFGLGLTRIANGDLDGGRGEIEVAVALDSSNALLRSYLGKAYFAERRSPLDEEQYAIAKELDPSDPTPFLYSAISKQASNRPVEALHDMQQSIDLNDNRAVFRSRQLLDEDRAVRQADLGQIYQDLGFRQPGLREAGKALATDPGNASAHRLLSSLYVGERRREIARVSNLFQAQMLQDVNLAPVQPSLSLANLKINDGLGGPAAPGFNEFTPLFQQNQVQFNAQGVYGNNGTYGGEGVVTGVYDGFSISGGGLAYRTDGWRDNNDVSQTVGNILMQWAATPKLNLQAEFITQNNNEGYLPFNFERDQFLRNSSRSLEQDMVRGGIRYTPDANSTFLLSYIFNSRDPRFRENSSFDPFDPSLGDIRVREGVDDRAHQGEAQYIYNGGFYNLTAGAAFNYVDQRVSTSIGFPEAPEDFTFLNFTDRYDATIRQPRGYLYSNLKFPQSVTWTLGFSYDSYTETAYDDLKVNSANPKLGVQWNITDDVLLRAAVFKAVKPALATNRSLEPTDVAGFNQLFDDATGTEFWRWGYGADWTITRDLTVGGEMSWRRIDSPILGLSGDSPSFQTTTWNERTHRVYGAWTPIEQIALSAEFVYDRFSAQQSPVTESGFVPRRVTTYSVPLGVQYFSPFGFFAGLGGTFVNQEVSRPNTAQFPYAADGEDSFFLLDTSIGYVLPKRFGLVSLQVRNLLDNDFDYQDDSYREFPNDPSSGPYFPDRTIIGRLVLNY